MVLLTAIAIMAYVSVVLLTDIAVISAHIYMQRQVFT